MKYVSLLFLLIFSFVACKDNDYPRIYNFSQIQINEQKLYVIDGSDYNEIDFCTGSFKTVKAEFDTPEFRDLLLDQLETITLDENEMITISGGGQMFTESLDGFEEELGFEISDESIVMCNTVDYIIDSNLNTFGTSISVNPCENKNLQERVEENIERFQGNLDSLGLVELDIVFVRE